MITERKESMSPDGFLRLIREDDGDIIICVGGGGENGGIESVTSIQFCTPFSGGGGSSKTYEALIQLMGAMAEDNLDPYQHHRAGDFNKDGQQAILDWAAQCAEAHKELGDYLSDLDGENVEESNDPN
jgi:hypothetical protein